MYEVSSIKESWNDTTVSVRTLYYRCQKKVKLVQNLASRLFLGGDIAVQKMGNCIVILHLLIGCQGFVGLEKFASY
ncbi:hypothetical protein RJT34_26367 [Clitoria ternatea]|uniref:Uncharacterized protein n=1 Tax=Clitoria ternatea TaxID=43366 RepID=A0AAN9F931_CLITE